MRKLFKKIVQFYLKVLTKIVISRHNPLIIAVAGTSNKTFVKEAILQELRKDIEVRGNPRSFNTEIGLPLAVLFLPSGYRSVFKWVDVLFSAAMISFFGHEFPKVLVLEMGVDRKGDMAYLLSMVKPKIAVVTCIDKGYPDLGTTTDDLFEEMKELISNVEADGLVLLNGDDRLVKKLKNKTRAKTLLFGSGEKNDILIKTITNSENKNFIEINFEGKVEKFKTDKFGQHNAEALAIAKRINWEFKKGSMLKKNVV